jgi:hypothetical protein
VRSDVTVMAVNIRSALSRLYNTRQLQVTIMHVKISGRNKDLVLYQVIPLKGAQNRATLAIVGR